MTQELDLTNLRKRAELPNALHGCSSDPCGSVVCQTARDRDELLTRLEQAERDRDAALEANKRWAHRSSRETSDLRKANASIARVRALRNTWCDASYDPMNSGLSIAGTVNAIDRALDGETRG